MKRQLLTRPWLGALIFALALLVANIIARPSFLPSGSWPDEFATFAPFALAAMASTPSILSGGGGLDLSIGPLLNLVSVLIVAVLLPHHVHSALPVFAIALTCGLLVGLINGVFVTMLRFQPILATLCGLFVLQGVGLAVQSSPESGSTPWLHDLGTKVGPIPGGLILIAVPLVIWGLLALSPFLGQLRAVGHDDVASFSSGVSVTGVRIMAYALGGLFAGLAGIALTAVTGTADPAEATQYTLPAIAAVAIGGTSLLGGRGSIFGSLTGAAIMYLAQTLLDSLGTSQVWLQVIYGALLILAIASSSQLSRLQPGRWRLA